MFSHLLDMVARHWTRQGAVMAAVGRPAGRPRHTPSHDLCRVPGTEPNPERGAAMLIACSLLAPTHLFRRSNRCCYVFTRSVVGVIDRVRMWFGFDVKNCYLAFATTGGYSIRERNLAGSV